MPSLWDYLHFNRQYSNKRNLEEGLFQIASQTCNILVKVNNTNNINLTRNDRSDEYGCAGPPKGKSSMQICVPKFRKNSITSGCNPGLSTVLESGSVGNASSSDEELEQWEQIFMMRDENGNSYNDKRKKRSIWCRPSCIPVSIVILLIILVVLVPLLDQPNVPHAASSQEPVTVHCSDECRLSLVESIPEGHMYPPNMTHTPTKNVWLDLIDEAQTTIEIASFYWSLRFNEFYPYNSSIEGEQVFQALYAAGSKRKIDLKIAQNWPSKDYPNIDTEYLVKKKAAQVRSLNFSKLLGGGVLHTKFWIVDRTHFYIGSANMDWRSLTQVYWQLGVADSVPATWPPALATDINMQRPANISDGQRSYGAYITRPHEFAEMAKRPLPIDMRNCSCVAYPQSTKEETHKKRIFNLHLLPFPSFPYNKRGGKERGLKLGQPMCFSMFDLHMYIHLSEVIVSEGKRRDANCTYLRRNSKICVKLTNPHLAIVVDYGLVTPNLGSMFNDWNANYEKITNMIVPRSTQLIHQDNDYGLFTVTLFKKVLRRNLGNTKASQRSGEAAAEYVSRYWPKIDDAIRAAALERRVRVRLLISWWSHSLPAQDHFLRSLTALSQALPGVDIQVKRFVVPSTPDQDKIPFARVNHNKYMVTDRTALIGTSNWSGDYFTTTAGVSFVFQDLEEGGGPHNGTKDIRMQLQEVFERDWTSPYAVPLLKL
ncbi:Phospholipase D3 [Papilio machaon]|uniref:Phospholipase D3 n=1 Tax=Papilio machaon TaxID=76193 RepID=A0A194RAS4_PAPMA|nr:Phospholipase D3 [Papilio machaon]